jgi:hypothetical protein
MTAMRLFSRIQRLNREDLKDLKDRLSYLFGRDKGALAQYEEFTRFFFEVFEVFAVQISSWPKHLHCDAMVFLPGCRFTTEDMP